ncbi:uncharacterized protein FOMMEDRAFT_151670 [Fomitiporia mediterranea MF3/22]|uniref:uncharacterized protein n=1 Tax=Fomitiporia mediterranea (strain MF3/22) TaxID=694068 RepID=UPI00044086BE|nr:uncharacterized protein FOMMEDRAFT_151670 [Fomitiporia mediterranea MF3/22]EJD06409.1 hypothetical protein FOMMEDRAFT_151670 [Fomitiporia mediterranea MF3/22]
MAHSAKAKAAGVSASSFLDLKAELAKKESDFKTGSVPRGEKKGKGTVWVRTNKGVAARAARDVAALAADRQTAESARAALERKAKIYEKLRKGKTGGLTEAQVDALLVDFDAKPDDHFSSDSEDVDESLIAPKALDDDDDPLVEYEDEFGRMRTARKSEVPRNLLPSAQVEEEDNYDPFVVRNPVNHFPVFEPTADRVASIQKAAEEAETPLEAHYDASREVRAKGAAFYAFSKDEEARAREMEALKKAREETEVARNEAGAIDVRPEENEGMTGEPESVVQGKGKESAKSRATEKRKREIEERRKLVEAKRRKTKGDEDKSKATSGGDTAVSVKVIGHFAAVEAAMSKSQTQTQTSKTRSRWDQQPKSKAAQSSVKSADDFLAQLEQDLNRKGK